jgi:hypothetical protein
VVFPRQQLFATSLRLDIRAPLGAGHCLTSCSRSPALADFKSSRVNTLPKAKSQAKFKRAKDRQKYAALRCKVGVAPPGFEVRRRLSCVAFRVFPAGRAGDTRVDICAISCFLSRFCVCVCM